MARAPAAPRPPGRPARPSRRRSPARRSGPVRRAAAEPACRRSAARRDPLAPRSSRRSAPARSHSWPLSAGSLLSSCQSPGCRRRWSASAALVPSTAASLVRRPASARSAARSLGVGSEPGQARDSEVGIRRGTERGDDPGVVTEHVPAQVVGEQALGGGRIGEAERGKPAAWVTARGMLTRATVAARAGACRRLRSAAAPRTPRASARPVVVADHVRQRRVGVYLRGGHGRPDPLVTRGRLSAIRRQHQARLAFRPCRCAIWPSLESVTIAGRTAPRARRARCPAGSREPRAELRGRQQLRHQLSLGQRRGQEVGARRLPTRRVALRRRDTTGGGVGDRFGQPRSPAAARLCGVRQRPGQRERGVRVHAVPDRIGRLGQPVEHWAVIASASGRSAAAQRRPSGSSSAAASCGQRERPAPGVPARPLGPAT